MSGQHVWTIYFVRTCPKMSGQGPDWAVYRFIFISHQSCQNFPMSGHVRTFSNVRTCPDKEKHVWTGMFLGRILFPALMSGHVLSMGQCQCPDKLQAGDYIELWELYTS